MTNPYAAPTAPITTTSDGGDEDGDNAFFIVSKRKFWVMNIATLGLYVVVWGYQNWSALKRRYRLSAWPVMRAIFAIFFMHSLMDFARRAAVRTGRNTTFPYKSAATLAVIVCLINYVLDRVVSKNVGYPYTDVVSLFFLLPVTHVVWRMQDAINQVSGDPEGTANARFTSWNILWMVLGAVLWGFSIWGFIAPEPV